MVLQYEYKLDNPVWHALSEVHSGFSAGFSNAKFYHPGFCPFGGTTNSESIQADADAYSELTDQFYIVGERPALPNNLKLRKLLVCDQMILYEKADIAIHEEIIKLNDNYGAELLELVNLVQPGYFGPKTSALGNYYGIFKDGRLVAAAGERMKMEQYTEVSAIVTHPGHTGKGYARQLIAHAVNNIFLQGKIPFLHVAEDNIGAIHLYNKLGFVRRRKMNFWQIATCS